MLVPQEQSYEEPVSQVSYEKKPSEVVEEYRMYNIRYLVTAIFILTGMLNILISNIFIPLQTTLQHLYGESITFINFGTVLVSNLIYIPANFVANKVVDTYGLRIGVLVGTVLTAIGFWCNYFCNYSFWYIFIGQCFTGIAQTFFYGTAQKVSNVWFGPSQRTMATTIINVSLNLGNAFGAYLPQLFVTIYRTRAEIIYHHVKVMGELKNMGFWLAIVESFGLVLTVLFFKEKPPTPPSKGALAHKLHFWQSLKTLFKDRNAMLFIFSTASIYAGYINYSSIIQQLVAPYNISGDQVSDVLTISIGTAFFGATIGGLIVAKIKKYKKPIMYFSGVSLLVLVGNYFAAKTQSVLLSGIAFCL